MRRPGGHDFIGARPRGPITVKSPEVEHPFLILKRDFGFTKTRYRGLAKNLNRLHIGFASVNLLMRARAVALMAR